MQSNKIRYRFEKVDVSARIYTNNLLFTNLSTTLWTGITQQYTVKIES